MLLLLLGIGLVVVSTFFLGQGYAELQQTGGRAKLYMGIIVFMNGIILMWFGTGG